MRIPEQPACRSKIISWLPALGQSQVSVRCLAPAGQLSVESVDYAVVGTGDRSVWQDALCLVSRLQACANAAATTINSRNQTVLWHRVRNWEDDRGQRGGGMSVATLILLRSQTQEEQLTLSTHGIQSYQNQILVLTWLIENLTTFPHLQVTFLFIANAQTAHRQMKVDCF